MAQMANLGIAIDGPVGNGVDISRQIKFPWGDKIISTDRTRGHGPLKVTPDAVSVDTTDMTIEQVVQSIIAIAERRIHGS